MASLLSGIPQSDANPLLADFNEPWDDMQARHQADMEKWRQDSTAAVDRAILDPDGFYADKPLPFHPDQQLARQQVTVRSYLTLANDGQPVEGDLYPELFRDRIARERFAGRGVGSDEAFAAEIRQEAEQRQASAELARELASLAVTSQILQATDEAGLQANSFDLWRETAKGKPGYQPGLDFAYREAWNETRAQAAAAVEPYLGPLKDVWQGMRSGSAEWYTAYQDVPAEDRPAFMASLALLARAMPAEEQPTFWGNLAKQARRDLQGQAINIMEGIGGALNTGSPLNDGDPFAEQAEAAADRDRKNFIADVERVRDQSFDPVKVLNPDSAILRTLERGAYAAPGALGTTVSALIPYAGPAATYYHMEESAYRDMRRTLMDGGMDDQAASDTAAGLAPLIAIPQAALERIGAGALVGKLPGLEKVLAATANRLTSTAARYGARTAAITGYETAIENAQDLIPQLLQDSAAALEDDVPGVVWRNGKDGFLDGYWEKTATTAVAILPLALIGGAGGLSADGRAKAFAAAPDLHLRVLGIPADGVARIRAAEAEGRYQAEKQIEAELATRDPMGEDAKDATQELAEELQSQKEAMAAAQRTGVMPTFYRSADGWTVRDGESGQEIGTATSADGALRLAIAHSAAIEEENADQIAAMATLLEAADVVAGTDQAGTRATETDLRPGQVVTTTQQSAVSEADEVRVRQQIEARERLGGSDGGTARLVLGQSVTETRQKVRRTVNRINAGGSVLTVFHESNHGFFREALATGRLTRDETIAVIRAIETAIRRKTTPDGQPLLFLSDPDTFAGLSQQDQDAELDEAVSELMEAEILRTRKTGSRKSPGHKIPPGLVTRNLTAMARLAPGATAKLRDFIAAVRAFWGLTFARATAIKAAIREGKLTEAELDAFKAKLFALGEQDDVEQMARDTEARILDGAEQAAELEGDPFSLGNSSFSLAQLSPADLQKLKDLGPEGYAEKVNKSGKWHPSDAYKTTANKLSRYVKIEKHPTLVEELNGVEYRRSDEALRYIKRDSEGNHVRDAAGELVYLTDEEASAMGLKTRSDDLAAFIEGQPVGMAVDEWGAVLVMVAEEYQKKGIGTKLATLYRTANPWKDSGGFTQAGYNQIFRVYEYLTGSRQFSATSPIGLMHSPIRAEDLEVSNVEVYQSHVSWAKAISWQYQGEEFLERMANPEAIEAAGGPEAYARKATADALIERESNPSYSLGNSALASLLGKDAVSRIKDPVRRAQAMSRIAREMEAARLQFERLELLSGSKRLKKSLAREASMRQALRQSELENEAWARHWQVLSDDDLTKLKAQPGHAFLSDPVSPLRGRLMSKTAAIKKHPDLFQLHNPGDYDGSENVSRSVFGGDLAPDQAAQEMFEAGLLKEPTPDALWELLEGEARHVAGMRQMLDLAKTEIREARTQAKDETNAWLREQGAVQDETFSDKQEILRSLAVLDGILSAVPAEIRGKVGGYTQLARIATNEAKLSFLKDRLAKVDVLLEKWLKDQFDREFRALLDRARPEKDEAGQKPRGKITPSIHALFRAVESAMTDTGAEVEAEAVRLESLAASGDYTAEEENHLNLTAAMLRLAGEWKNADAARREAAVIQGTKLFEGGYMARKIELSRQRERRAKTSDTFQTATKATGDDQIRRDTAREQETRRGAVSAVKANLLSFEGVMQEAFGLDSPEVDQFVEWERRAANAKQDALQHKYDLLDDLLASLAGGKYKGEQLRAKLQDPEAVSWTDWKGNRQSVSELHAVHMTMMWRQEDGRRHMAGYVDDQGAPSGDWHYRQQDLDAIEDQLSDNAKAIRLHLSETYATEWERINEVFEQNEGVSLPRHKLYAPLTVDPVNAAANQMLDPVTGNSAAPSLTFGSLRNRSQTAVAKPNFDQDALQIYLGHVRQMEHYIAYSTFAREMMAVTNRREVRDAIKETAGPELQKTLAAWLDYFATGSVMDKSTMFRLNRMMTGVMNRFSAATLVGRVSVLAIQSTQLLAAWSYMPTGAYLSRLARLLSGRLDWSGALGSEYIQRRRLQMPATIQQLMEGLRSAKPSRLIYTQRKMGETIAGADALFTAGTFAITYDYHLTRAIKQGMTGQQATDYARQQAEAATDRVAQPVRPGTRSIIEVTSTNPAFKMLWNFASDARQKLAIAAFQHADRTPAEKARAIAVVWLAGGIVSTIIRSAMRDMRDDGEDDEIFDERNWDPTRLALQSLTGPLGGLPYLGDAIESAIFATAGEYLPSSGTPLDNVSKAVPAAKRLITGDVDGIEQALKDAEAILSAGALADDRISAAASLSHLARDLFAIGDNFIGD